MFLHRLYNLTFIWFLTADSFYCQKSNEHLKKLLKPLQQSALLLMYAALLQATSTAHKVSCYFWIVCHPAFLL